jgi:hypothetical protein
MLCSNALYTPLQCSTTAVHQVGRKLSEYLTDNMFEGIVRSLKMLSFTALLCVNREALDAQLSNTQTRLSCVHDVYYTQMAKQSILH